MINFKFIQRYKRVPYNIDIMQKSACLVVNPIMVDNFGFFFNSTKVGQVLDLMMVLS